MPLRIAVSGATGFVGSALGRHLASKDFCLRGLTRRVNSQPPWAQEWMICDPMNLEAICGGLKGVDVAVYLMHSMMAPAHYTQGGFSDLDRLLAHNFARAAQRNHVKKIIYLSGIIPKERAPLSEHLSSRKEVEDILALYGTPVITLRTGIIVGSEGSSFQLLLKVVQTFPIMLCPYWSQSLSAPIDLEDLLKLLEYAVTSATLNPGHYDIGGSETITYVDMMKKTAHLMGLKRVIIPIPFFYESLSAVWVSFFTKTPYELVSPLMHSLRHNVLPENNTILKKAGVIPKSFSTSLKEHLQNREKTPHPIKKRCQLFQKKDYKRRLCSVQTYTLQEGMNPSAHQMSLEYAHWLGQLIPNLLRINKTPEGDWTFHFGKVKSPLMILRANKKFSTHHFMQYTISEGLLVGNTAKDPGRMEFHIIQTVNKPPQLIIGVLDFCTPMPWLIYRCTQAQFHKMIMMLFRLHLYLKSKKIRSQSFT